MRNRAFTGIASRPWCVRPHVAITISPLPSLGAPPRALTLACPLSNIYLGVPPCALTLACPLSKTSPCAPCP